MFTLFYLGYLSFNDKSNTDLICADRFKQWWQSYYQQDKRWLCRDKWLCCIYT